MARLCVIKTIDSAHGKHVHGHTFRIEINFVAKLQNGMVGNLDFHEIKPKIDEVIQTLDKTYIDEVLGCRGTVENIAIYILNSLKEIDSLSSVLVYEGMNQYVEIFKSELEEEVTI